MQKVIILMLCNGEKILYNNDTRAGMHAQGYACGGRSLRIKETTKKAAAQEHASVSGKKGECDYG